MYAVKEFCLFISRQKVIKHKSLRGKSYHNVQKKPIQSLFIALKLKSFTTHNSIMSFF